MIAKTKIPKIKEYILANLPIPQTKVWKDLDVSHQDVSDVAKLMESEHTIRRIKVNYEGRKTFLLQKNGCRSILQSPVMLKVVSSPCIGCDFDCTPTICEKIERWVTS